MMLYTPIQWVAVWFLVHRYNQHRGGRGLFNAVGLTVTSSAKKMAGLTVEIRPPERAPGLDVSVCRGQAMQLHRHVIGDFFPKPNAVEEASVKQY